MKMLLSLAAAVFAAATPVYADVAAGAGPLAGPTAAAAAPSGTGQAPASGQSPARSAKTRYCVMTEPSTGSRIGRRVCQTRDRWLQQGFDPLAAK